MMVEQGQGNRNSWVLTSWFPSKRPRETLGLVLVIWVLKANPKWHISSNNYYNLQSISNISTKGGPTIQIYEPLRAHPHSHHYLLNDKIKKILITQNFGRKYRTKLKLGSIVSFKFLMKESY